MCDIGKKEQYNNEAPSVLKIQCFSARAFVHLENVVVDALELVSDDEDIPDDLISYFEGIYNGEGVNDEESTSSIPCGTYDSIL